MIPPFEPDGNLPPGIHQATWSELAGRFGATPRRRQLLVGLKAALEALRAAGCATVYIGGSFFDDSRAAQKAKYGGELFPNVRMRDSTLTFLELFQLNRATERREGIIRLDLRGGLL